MDVGVHDLRGRYESKSVYETDSRKEMGRSPLHSWSRSVYHSRRDRQFPGQSATERALLDAERKVVRREGGSLGLWWVERGHRVWSEGCDEWAELGQH